MGLGVEVVQTPGKSACGLVRFIDRLHIKIHRGLADRSDKRIGRRLGPAGCRSSNMDAEHPAGAASNRGAAQSCKIAARPGQSMAIRE